MNSIKYKNFTAEYYWDEEDEYFYGLVKNSEDTLFFAGDNLSELKENYIETIDDHLREIKAFGHRISYTLEQVFKKSRNELRELD